MDTELRKHLHKVLLELLASCYTHDAMNPDTLDDAITYIEEITPGLSTDDLGSQVYATPLEEWGWFPGCESPWAI